MTTGSHPFFSSGSPSDHDPRLGRTWALPQDATCCGVARSLTGAVLAGCGLPIEQVREAELMVSELATNAYEHARGHPPHELWIYPVFDRELVCATFDAAPRLPCPDVRHQEPRAQGQGQGQAAPNGAQRADFGRGLTLVHELSGGRWGAHLTRSRLTGSVSGKVVWFGVPLTGQAGPGVLCRPAVADPASGAQALKELLIGRGVSPVYVSHRGGLWVVAIPFGLTVWIRDGRFELPGCPDSMTAPLAELPVVVEHLIRRYEQHRLADR